jgi:hypothetical protein
MVDWTVLGVAALGVVRTLGAGAIGFAGPSWNERRIQAARDQKELRRAARLVKHELTDLLGTFDTYDENAEDALTDIRLVFGLVPSQRSA